MLNWVGKVDVFLKYYTFNIVGKNRKITLSLGVRKGDNGWFKYSKGVPGGVVNERVWYGKMTFVHDQHKTLISKERKKA